LVGGNFYAKSPPTGGAKAGIWLLLPRLKHLDFGTPVFGVLLFGFGVFDARLRGAVTLGRYAASADALLD
jgi:hypothetical protein